MNSERLFALVVALISLILVLLVLLYLNPLVVAVTVPDWTVDRPFPRATMSPYPVDGFAPLKSVGPRSRSYVHFGITTNIYDNEEDPLMAMPFMCFKSIAKQTFTNWTLVLVANGNLREESIPQIFELVRRAGIPRTKFQFHIMKKSQTESRWTADGYGNLISDQSQARDYKRQGYPGTFARNLAFEVCENSSVITHVAHIDVDDSMLEWHLQQHALMYLKFPQVGFVQSASIWLEAGPYPTYGEVFPNAYSHLQKSAPGNTPPLPCWTSTSAVSWDLRKINPRFRLIWEQAATYQRMKRVNPTCKYPTVFILTPDGDLFDRLRQLCDDSEGKPIRPERPYGLVPIYSHDWTHSVVYTRKAAKPQIIEMFRKEREKWEGN